MTQASNLAKGGSNFNADGDLSLTTGVTGTLPVANGGTGSTTTTGAANAILPSQTSNSGKYLTTNGTDTSWGTVTSNPGTVTSITAGTGLSGGTITSSGTIAVANTAVTAGSYTTANITVNAQGQLTAASSGSVSAVTSVATGNGLSGGTITSTGTLVVACPTFNTVGSYCFTKILLNNQAGTLSAGSNYAVGSGNLQMQTGSMVQNTTDGSVSTDYSTSISGTWKYMGASRGTNYGDALNIMAVSCRVS